MTIEEVVEHATESGNPPADVLFNKLFSHLMPHKWFSFDLFGITWNITNHTTILIGAGLILFLFFWLGYSRKKELRQGAVPRGRFTNFVESLVAFVRDEMIYEVMGPEVGRRYAPLFLTQFFFIWVVNLLGNMPLGKFGGAPTAHIMVTTALASTTLVAMVAAGIKTSGPVGMWRDLLPKGLPPVIREVLFVVEVLGFFIKPFALTIRLFANMFGGHLVVLSLFGMIYLFKSWVIMGAVLPMSLFVGILELFVATLQAFIFTFLSIMFVQLTLHPEH